jgi:putative transposase
VELWAADEQLLRELTERARTGGLQVTGEDGLLGRLTSMVIEGALEGELDDHLGYGKHARAGLPAAVPSGTFVIKGAIAR